MVRSFICRLFYFFKLEYVSVKIRSDPFRIKTETVSTCHLCLPVSLIYYNFVVGVYGLFDFIGLVVLVNLLHLFTSILKCGLFIYSILQIITMQ